MTVTHHKCTRCTGRGEILVPAHPAGKTKRLVRCPVCLGLGEYETSDRFKRPDIDEGYMAVHSKIPIEDAIALLPEER